MNIALRVKLVLMLLCTSSLALAGQTYNIVTGSENGTYVRIGNDLAKYVAGSADIDLQVLPSNGSIENIKRLRDEKGTKFSLIQSDVYQAFKDQATDGNAEAARIIQPLRVIVPLYDEEVYFIVRADSTLDSIHDIQDKKINIGPLGSGAAMTSTTLYRLMFGTSIPERNVTMLSHENALIRLAKEKDLDVVVVVGGQPSTILTGMEPGVEKLFKLLKLDESNPATKRAMAVYKKAAIKSSIYPGWLTTDLPCFSVTTFLVTYDYNMKSTKDSLVRFAKSLCDNFSILQKDGHPKWRQVSLQLPVLSKGWSYYSPTEQELGKCRTLRPKQARPCALQEKVMGFCTDE